MDISPSKNFMGSKSIQKEKVVKGKKNKGTMQKSRLAEIFSNLKSKGK